MGTLESLDKLTVVSKVLFDERIIKQRKEIELLRAQNKQLKEWMTNLCKYSVQDLSSPYVAPKQMKMVKIMKDYIVTDKDTEAEINRMTEEYHEFWSSPCMPVGIYPSVPSCSAMPSSRQNNRMTECQNNRIE